MEILKRASAGTVESVVQAQFGQEILRTANELLDQLDVKNATVRITDRGALDCVLRARLETAVLRGKE